MTATSAIQERTEQATDKHAIRPFHMNVPEADRADLRRRIQATRWPDRETVADRSQRAQLAMLQELLQYPLHPRPLSAQERAAFDHHARLAGLRVRADQAHWSAHGPEHPELFAAELRVGLNPFVVRDSARANTTVKGDT